MFCNHKRARLTFALLVKLAQLDCKHFFLEIKQSVSLKVDNLNTCKAYFMSCLSLKKLYSEKQLKDV